MMEKLSKKERIDVQQCLYRELSALSRLMDDSHRDPSLWGKMASLVKKARYDVNAERDEDRIEQLLNLFYSEWGFHCSEENYFFVDNMMLLKVIEHRQGMPVALGALVLYLAASLDLPLYPVNFPTQLLLRAEIINQRGNREVFFINPWDGKRISREQLVKRLEGEWGYGAELKPEYLAIAEPVELFDRLNVLLKMALANEGRYEDTLKLIDFRLILRPDDPYEIRDRGMILASLGCYQAALDDFNYFIDQCPDDPTAALLKLEMPKLEKQNQDYQVH